MSKVVFVGNVPYHMGEEQLIDTFKSVGHVVGFRLVYDRETGKPKGYGFCEFAGRYSELQIDLISNHETAASAVRNLNNTDCGGRALRIDLADSDPFLEGKTTVHGEILDGGGETRAQWRQREKKDVPEDYSLPRPSARDPSDFLKSLPQGVPLPPGTTALDATSHRLATIDPPQLTEVLAQMKAFVINHPDQARMLLVAHPQLAYGLFQALLLNRIVDPAILQRMLAATQAHTNSTPVSAPPRPPVQAATPLQMPPIPSQYPPFPPTMAPSMQSPVPPVQHTPYYQQPPPPQQPAVPPQTMPTPTPAPAPAPAATAAPAPAQINLPDNIDPTQRAMLQHVLSLPADQIPNLPPNEREAIMLLRAQFLGPNAN